jgi:hypothetical protein
MARIRPATRLKAPRFSLAGTAALNERDVNTRGSGVLTNAVSRVSGSGIRTPSSVVTGLLQFAEIPEIVFVRGFTDQSEHLGPWMMDPENRWTPGDIENASGWVPNRTTSLQREDGLPLPNGVTYNPSTGILSYNGADPTSASVSFTAQLVAGVARSNVFRVRVLRPTVIWGTGALTDPFITSTFSGVPARDPADGGVSGFYKTNQDLISTIRPDTDPNVLLILGGSYQATTDGVTNYGDLRYKSGIRYIYTIGDPRSRPAILGNSISSQSSGNKSMRVAYWKNLEFNDYSIQEGSYENTLQDIAPKLSYYCNLYMHESTRSGSTAISTDNREGKSGVWVWDQNPVKSYIWKLDTIRNGGLDGDHQMYMEGRPRSYLQLNLCRLRGGRRNNTCKSTRYYKSLYNSYLTSFEDDNDITVGQRSAELVDWVGCGEGVIYNNHLRSGYAIGLGGPQNGLIRKRLRREWWGADQPAYPDLNFDEGTTYLVDGGYSAPDGFDATGQTYKNPAYWAAVTAKSLSDHTNPYTFKYWVSYNTFEWAQDGTSPRKPWASDSGTAPYAAAFQFSTNNIPGTLAPGWVERSANFHLNNTIIGWVETDQNKPGSWFDYNDEEPTEVREFPPPQEEVLLPGAYYNASVGRWVHGPGPHAYPKANRRLDYVAGLNTPWSPQSPVPLPSWFKITGTTDGDGGAVGPTVLESAAAPLASQSWSAALDIPSLSVQVPREDPQFPLDYPDRSRGTTAWIWGSRCVWDSLTKRILGVFMSDGPSDDPHESKYATILQVYDENSNDIRVFDNPIIQKSTSYNITSGHLFDCNAIDVTNRRLYKPSGPYFVSGSGYVTPQINVWDLNKIISGADEGAASLTPIPRAADYDQNLDMRNTVAPVMDFFPTMGTQGSLVYWHCNAAHQKVWIYDFASAAWSEIDLSATFPITAPNQPVWHGVGHYHPIADKMIFGGGSYRFSGDPEDRANKQFFVMSRDRSIVEVQQSPVVLSVNNQADARKACFAPSPNKRESLAFHKDGNIYVFNWDSGTWSTRTGAMGGVVPDWACAIPDYNVIAVGDFAVGASKIYLYRN